MEKECEHCGDIFPAQRSTARYCGGTCRLAALRARQGEELLDGKPKTPPGWERADEIHQVREYRPDWLDQPGFGDPPEKFVAAKNGKPR